MTLHIYYSALRHLEWDALGPSGISLCLLWNSNSAKNWVISMRKFTFVVLALSAWTSVFGASTDKNTITSISVVSSAIQPSGTAKTIKDPASLVNLFIGTRNGGHTFPGNGHPYGYVRWNLFTLLDISGATLPHGMVKVGMDTNSPGNVSDEFLCFIQHKQTLWALARRLRRRPTIQCYRVLAITRWW